MGWSLFRKCGEERYSWGIKKAGQSTSEELENASLQQLTSVQQIYKTVLRAVSLEWCGVQTGLKQGRKKWKGGAHFQKVGRREGQLALRDACMRAQTHTFICFCFNYRLVLKVPKFCCTSMIVGQQCFPEVLHWLKWVGDDACFVTCLC